MSRRRIVIMGAAGRDFHDFNVVYRKDPTTEVVAFTAAQIPNIADRRYPTEVACLLYGSGIGWVTASARWSGQPPPLARSRSRPPVD